MENIIQSLKIKMEKTLEQLHSELAKIRTGRANISLLDGIRVSCYGAETPLSQVATISVEDSRTLAISPWDKSLISDIEKAIINSSLGLNPSSKGDLIRVPLPPLSEERRKDFVKLAKSQGENSKIALRNLRRDALSKIKDHVKAKEISEDDERRLQNEIQGITDDFIKNVDSQVSAKEADLIKI